MKKYYSRMMTVPRGNSNLEFNICIYTCLASFPERDIYYTVRQRRRVWGFIWSLWREHPQKYYSEGNANAYITMKLGLVPIVHTYPWFGKTLLVAILSTILLTGCKIYDEEFGSPIPVTHNSSDRERSQFYTSWMVHYGHEWDSVKDEGFKNFSDYHYVGRFMYHDARTNFYLCRDLKRVFLSMDSAKRVGFMMTVVTTEQWQDSLMKWHTEAVTPKTNRQ